MSAPEKLLTFDEFRLSQDDVLHAQREVLRDAAAAEAILRQGSRAKGWISWDGNALATES